METKRRSGGGKREYLRIGMRKICGEKRERSVEENEKKETAWWR